MAALAPRGMQRLGALVAARPLQPACDSFYFLRHGQTPRNAQRIFQDGHEPLSELGLAQARAAAQALSAHSASSLVCSDYVRAHHTARIVAETLSLTPRPHAGLRERHFGALIGSSSADIDWDCAPEAGETLDEFVHRTRDALDHALTHPAPVLIVAHGGTLYVLAALLGVELQTPLIANAQPLHFVQREARWQVTPLGPVSGAVQGAGLA